MRCTFTLALVAMLAGCSLTPPLETPAAPVAATYPNAPAGQDGNTNAGDLGWRTVFTDPRLQSLIALALENNRDLRMATLNAQAVYAQFGGQRAGQFPHLEGQLTQNRERTGNPASVQEQAQIGLGLSAFELDLFGRMRALTDAAFSRYLASVEGQRAAHITLVGAVADAYFAEQWAREQHALALQTLKDWRLSLDLAVLRRQASQASGLDVAQAQEQVATAEAEVEGRQRELARAQNALAQVLGTEVPADLPAPLPLSAKPVVTQLPAGLPSDLLIRRPDILQAEQALRAANADIGAARAAFFPRLSLTASLGIASGSLNDLFSDNQRVWRFSPQITQPIFNAGQLRAELRVAKVRKSMAIAAYEQAIQTAFREVADGLAGTATYGRQIAAKQQAVGYAQERVALSNLRYLAGLDGRLEWLDAQRQLSSAQQALLDLQRDELQNAVALYKALGGGLAPETPV